MPESLDLADDGGCFACGRLNPIGLRLEFAEQDGEYVTYFTPRKEHQGFVGIVHGGIISTVLDEVMARYIWSLGRRAVTAEITVRLKRPARVGSRLRFAGKIDSEDRRLLHTSARATDKDGAVVAEAAARMVEVAQGDRA